MYCFTICSAICFFQVAFTWPTDIRERELFTRETNGLGIEGSVLTNVKKLPYQAAILSKGNYIGAGAVIGNKFILTAYFVVAGYGSDLNVRVGSNKALEGGQLLDVGKVITHNKTKNYSYNVALLKLKTAIKFSSLVKPIKLATSEKNNGSVVVISGYGYTAGQYPGNYGKLQSGKQKTIKTVTCQSFYTELILDESNSCAYSPKVCACNSDFGDPLVQKNTLIGHFLGGSYCCYNTKPQVFSSVPSFYKWVKEQMKAEGHDETENNNSYYTE